MKIIFPQYYSKSCCHHFKLQVTLTTDQPSDQPSSNLMLLKARKDYQHTLQFSSQWRHCSVVQDSDSLLPLPLMNASSRDDVEITTDFWVSSSLMPFIPSHTIIFDNWYVFPLTPILHMLISFCFLLCCVFSFSYFTTRYLLSNH